MRDERFTRREFTGDQIRYIRRSAAEGTPRRELAHLFGVGLETISRIIRRDTYPNVPDDSQVEAAEGVAKEILSNPLAAERALESLRRLQAEVSSSTTEGLPKE